MIAQKKTIADNGIETLKLDEQFVVDDGDVDLELEEDNDDD